MYLVRHYEVQLKSRADKKWLTVGISDTNYFEFDLLIDDQSYRIRVRPIGRLGITGPWSKPSKPFRLVQEEQ